MAYDEYGKVKARFPNIYDVIDTLDSYLVNLEPFGCFQKIQGLGDIIERVIVAINFSNDYFHHLAFHSGHSAINDKASAFLEERVFSSKNSKMENHLKWVLCSLASVLAYSSFLIMF